MECCQHQQQRVVYVVTGAALEATVPATPAILVQVATGTIAGIAGPLHRVASAALGITALEGRDQTCTTCVVVGNTRVPMPPLARHVTLERTMATVGVPSVTAALSTRTSQAMAACRVSLAPLATQTQTRVRRRHQRAFCAALERTQALPVGV